LPLHITSELSERAAAKMYYLNLVKAFLELDQFHMLEHKPDHDPLKPGKLRFHNLLVPNATSTSS
jgi:hypothetical protein